jgi:hypothetical protein
VPSTQILTRSQTDHLNPPGFLIFIYILLVTPFK